MSDFPHLSTLVGAPGIHKAKDFIADETGSVSVLSLLRPPQDPETLESVRGKTVLLALPTQMATIAALIQLDGVASRIVIWPQDPAQASLSAAVDQANVDVLLTSWALPAQTASPAIPHARPVGATAGTVAPPTQWVLFTSGTTGQPRMIVHTLQTLCGHLLAHKPSRNKPPEWCTFYDSRRYGGMQVLLRALTGGGSLTLSSPDETPGAFLARAARAKPTHFLGTPSHWRRALMTDAHRLISPTYVRLSGEVADQIILDRLRAAYPAAEIVHAFASTEAGLAFEVTDGLTGFPAAIIDDLKGGVELEIGTGTLRVRSSRIAAGSLARTLKPVADGAGFVDTGDAITSRDGRYYFAGRVDGVVNVGGRKVYPEEVEAVINQHPAVQMSLVTARPSPIIGAIVTADIVSKPGESEKYAFAGGAATRLEREIQIFCRARLQPFQVPSRIRLVASLPLSPAGKLVRAHA